MLAVTAAASRQVLTDAQRGDLFRVVGRRFGVLALAAALVLAGTGADLASDRFANWSALSDTGDGKLVLAKTVIFAVLLVLALVHSLVLGPRIRELRRRAVWHPDNAEGSAQRLRRTAALSGVTSALMLLGTAAVFVLAADLAV